MPTGITWDRPLADRLVRGLSLSVLGQLALPEPLARLLVLGRSDSPPDGKMALAAVLVPTAAGGTAVLSPLGLGRAGATRIPVAVAERFSGRPAAGGFFVPGPDGEDRFLVAPGLMRHVTVTCGSWPLLLPLIGARAPALPSGDLGSVAADLDRLCEVLDAVVGAMYEAQDLPVPPLDVVLRPTAASVEGAVSGLRKLTRSTLSRLPTNRAPGEVFDPSSDAPTGEEPTSFADVGGQEAARTELETICLAVKQPDAFRAWGARPPRGVLLYGPPGTGKTLLARALAHEAGARFLHVRASDVVSKWYGEAEKRMQSAFDRARAEAPTVMFFDEIDALARNRELAHEATHRIVSTFLENMDGLREVEGVIVLAATNRPEAVDEALLRPGRFDRLVEVPLPVREDRRAIFRVHMRRAERKAARPLFAELDAEQWDALLDASKGFSGADVAETVRRALEAKVRSGATAGRIEADELLAVAGGVARPF
ncbi:MAG TPA: ATP-binding protein [Terriglobales bacterium]|nr:ATP-binding protein [Terriglobales bacterium]